MDNLDSVPAQLSSRLRAATDYLEAMKIVVPLITDADVTVTAAHSPDRERLAVMGKERNLTGAITRLLSAFDKNGPAA
jgi:hypothetical protein